MDGSTCVQLILCGQIRLEQISGLVFTRASSVDLTFSAPK